MIAAARLAAGAIVVALAAMPLSGHVLDQFVQASRIQLAPDHVAIELDLTPGIELAPAVFVAINTDRDGVISPSEGRAHAALVLADLALEVDGRALDLELASADYPTFDEMRAGLGTIRVRAVAPVAAAAGTHRLHYRNNHRQDASVYLVNALVPTAPGMTLGAPRRDRLQQSFTLDYTQDRASASRARSTTTRELASALAIALAVPVYLSVRLLRRRHRPRAQL